METNKPNWFVRILIILFTIFIGGLVFFNFFKADPPLQISNGLIILLAFITILVLSESFDNFSLGKLLTLTRKVKEKENQNQELKKENSDLRNQLINITTSVTQKQVNSTFVLTDELAKMFTVKQADEPEREQKQEAEENRIVRQEETTSRRYIPFGQFEEIALPKFLQMENLQQFPILRDAKLVNHFQQIDPISEYSPVFDGYIKTIDTEIFIELKPKVRGIITLRERLYLMLSKINYYRSIKRVNAYLFLVFVIRPDEDVNQTSYERIIQEFQPALANGILRISEVQITEQELASIRENMR